MDFQSTEDDPLQTALATAFTDSPILEPRPLTHPSVSRLPDPGPVQEQVEEGGVDDSWKEDYDQHLTIWRTESAVAREKADQERERWRLIREQEEKQKLEDEREREQEKLSGGGVQRKDSEWETVTRSSSTAESAPKRAQGVSAKVAAAAAYDTRPPHNFPNRGDSIDLVTEGTTQGHGGSPMEQNPGTVPAPHSITDDHGLSSSRTWEEVPSDDSSFPSLSFPERSAAASPDLRERPLYRHAPAPPSVTLAIFDSSLSCRARILALISSIGINLVLPFINGVMLGFGEIFAKNVVGFFGWNTSTAVGLRAAPRKR